MVKCSCCGKAIPKRTRYVLGKSGGKYHVACSGNLKDKSYAYTK